MSCVSRMVVGWLWKRKPDPTAVLVQQIIQEGIERRKIDAEIASKSRELELRKLELEMEHIEQLGDERRKDRADKEAARSARRQAAALAREAYKRNQHGGNKPVGRVGPLGGTCKPCENPSDPSMTAADIEWHSNGHQPGPSIWSSFQ